MISLEKMKEKTRMFYENLGCKLTEDNIDLAVQSLTMPCYANEFKQKIDAEIGDHRALATVGDEYWGAYVLAVDFSSQSTMGELTEEVKKSIASNAIMNGMGRGWLQDNLFCSNNDLVDNNSSQGNGNNKGYATALEAVVGFLFLEYPDKVLTILKEKFPKDMLKQYINQIKSEPSSHP